MTQQDTTLIDIKRHECFRSSRKAKTLVHDDINFQMKKNFNNAKEDCAEEESNSKKKKNNESISSIDEENREQLIPVKKKKKTKVEVDEAELKKAGKL